MCIHVIILQNLEFKVKNKDIYENSSENEEMVSLSVFGNISA